MRKIRTNYFNRQVYNRISKLIEDNKKIQLETFYIGSIMKFMPKVTIDSIGNDKYILSYE